MATINLPKAKRKAVAPTPRRMILFSKPKVGKSVTASLLENNLILDFEEGTLAIDAMSMQIKKIQDVYDICDAIIEEGKANGGKYPYDYITIDTASALEEMCLPMAEQRYARSPEGKKWFLADETGKKLHPESGKAQYGSIMHLPYGKGYQLVAEVFSEVIDRIQKVAPKIIILAHSTYATMKKKNEEEVTSLDLMLQKRSKFAATFKADAIGYIYREGKQNFINFTASEDVGAGGRHRYLEKEHILISEFIEDDKGNENIVAYWDKIFAPEKKVKSKQTKK